jgi:UPF0755 protein
MRKAPLIVVGLLALLGAGTVATLLHLRDEALAAGPATEDQKITVAAGSSLRTVLSQLHDHGLLPHPRLFELYLRYGYPATRGGLPVARPLSIHKGRYLIPVGLKPLDILEQLEQGRVILEQFTIVEGWTFTQVRAALARLPVVTHTLDAKDDAGVMAALGHEDEYPEGRFAPDTYRFAEETTDREILELAHAAQARILARAWESRVKDLPLASAEEALALASIIEKETGNPMERPRIAGVFVNRLRQGMRLQSDPTVIYGIRDRYDGDIRTRDLRTDTPYNTYTRGGLPPTPIAMPGNEAIWAATHPDQTDALFFVAVGDGTGSHYFSSTLAEHNLAVRRYLDRLKRSGPST